MLQEYRTTSRSATTWPEPFEGTYQSQSRRASRVPGARRPDITLPARLLIASAVALGKERPHGMVTWLAEVWQTNRQTIYDIGARVEHQLEAAGRTVVELEKRTWSRKQLAGAALTLLIGGAMTVRRTRQCLSSVLGVCPAVGWLSDLIDEAGERAGAALAAADWSGATTMIVARDELYDGDLAFLLMVDTRSMAIVSGEVVETVDGDTWALMLAEGAQGTAYRVAGLVEDAATYFAPSVEGARALLDAPWGPTIQKDHWHLLRHAGDTARAVERASLKILEAAEAKATRQPNGWWLIRQFDGWEVAHERAVRALDRDQAMRDAVSLLGPALELVDARTDTLLDRETAEWYLDVIIDGLNDIGLTEASSLADTIHLQRPDLLTYHDWLACDLPAWRRAAREHFGDDDLVAYFEQIVLRSWRLKRALTNGRNTKSAADHSRTLLRSLCLNDPAATSLAADLSDALDHAVRASSAVECVNSILRMFLSQRRHLHDRRRAQHWLNLLILWHNMRIFERGKRADNSPYGIADVTVFDPDGFPTTDWLQALGYASAA